MQIVEFRADTLRFVEHANVGAAPGGFHWIFLDRSSLAADLPALQKAASALGGSALLDLHCQDLASEVHPSYYDYTSVYDVVIFRRLASSVEAQGDVERREAQASERTRQHVPGAFRRISTRAVGFVVFDRLLISVHPDGCFTAKSFVQRYLADAVHSEGLSVPDSTASGRNRLPTRPSDLMLRMINLMVDSYLDLRKQLTTQIEHWQAELLDPSSRFNNWNALMSARNELHTLEDLCEEQHDAMQEWLDTLREQPLGSGAGAVTQAEHDGLVARCRDVIEHIERVSHHVRRLEMAAETAVQIHFGAQGNRTNNIMRTLTALTAVFLPLNLITGFFGMNFEFLPLIHEKAAFWWTLAAMVLIALATALLFWRKRYLARTGR